MNEWEWMEAKIKQLRQKEKKKHKMFLKGEKNFVKISDVENI